MHGLAPVPLSQTFFYSLPSLHQNGNCLVKLEKSELSSFSILARVLLDFQNPIQGTISGLQIGPHSNNLLVSSWDSSLRLYDVDNSTLRLEAPSEAALLGCCFLDESLAFSAGSDGFIRRYELQSGIFETVRKHNDSVTHIRYSDQTYIFSSVTQSQKLQETIWSFVSIWDFPRKRRILEVSSARSSAFISLLKLARFPNSVASLSYNCGGELLAVASSCTYQEAKEREDSP
ncbi:unnamed protein product [Citrullus colocynthis]|uniref:Uncharacterized protein n=1 Tax=Citrullus colocynthis TaxID=252529 RepID=A0ABP0ZE82_9ROSI